MHELLRQQALDRCRWNAGKDGGITLQYLEAWSYEGDLQADAQNFETGSISSETELEAWLRRPAPSRQRHGKLLGSVRLLACDWTPYPPLDFPLSRKAFESIESAFAMSPMTVPIFESEAGTYSRFLVYDNDDGTKLRRMHTILKAPQKREIFNWGLSLSYDTQSSTTTGLLYGTNVRNLGVGENQDEYKAIKRFVERVQASISACQHPMLLPCLFLSEHLTCINEFSSRGTVLTETVDIEHALGVTKVGQSTYLPAKGRTSGAPPPSKAPAQAQHTGNPYLPSLESPRILSREETEALTVRINTQSTRIVFTARSPEWNLACSRFLLTTLAEISPSLDPSHTPNQHDCTQLLEHNIILAEAVASHIASLKERMALQLNVLYNFVAQLDNQTSAELAASTSRDSTSMKILAFISALFLPGNFVSAMFSMDMFDWRDGGGDALSSGKFWIYWAAAVPLTAVTLLGWGTWWYFELGRFDRKIRSIRGRSQPKELVKQGP